MSDLMITLTAAAPVFIHQWYPADPTAGTLIQFAAGEANKWASNSSCWKRNAFSFASTSPAAVTPVTSPPPQHGPAGYRSLYAWLFPALRIRARTDSRYLAMTFLLV
jgi:hypothetical protein